MCSKRECGTNGEWNDETSVFDVCFLFIACRWERGVAWGYDAIRDLYAGSNTPFQAMGDGIMPKVQ